MSELRGLMWKDIICLQNRGTGVSEPHIHVQRQTINDRQIPTFSDRLKTRASNRFIPIPSTAFKLLQQHKENQKKQAWHNYRK